MAARQQPDEGETDDFVLTSNHLADAADGGFQRQSRNGRWGAFPLSLGVGDGAAIHGGA